MNNTLCLGIFAALVGFRGLTWQYSAEVTVILLIQVIMGIVALLSGFLNRNTYLVSSSCDEHVMSMCYACDVYCTCIYWALEPLYCIHH